MRLFINTIVILLITFSHAQSSTDFDRLLNIFDSKGHEIPVDLSKKYFDFTLNNRQGKIYADRIICKTNNYILLSTKIECIAGGNCMYSDLTPLCKVSRLSGTLINPDSADF
ncbi:hypothetical protein [Flavivirga eckloniae]|uniref:hypothetical protein n=1 Tax=Flavivirga eckloniae TaxID=1803846 RepID=UPI00131579DA|nr:hypothetical protein [Flavivirga eckloniae]